jgi:hypothetical protein
MQEVVEEQVILVVVLLQLQYQEELVELVVEEVKVQQVEQEQLTLVEVVDL